MNIARVQGPVLLAAALLLTPPAQAQSPFEAARTAYNAGRYEEFLGIIRRVERASPGNPNLLTQIARGEARLGRSEAALAALTSVADAGATADTKLPDFEPLSALPGWADLAARLEANARPAGTAEIAFRLRQGGRSAEGIAADPATGTTYLGDLAGGTLAVRTSGGQETVWPFPAELKVKSTVGLRVDPERRSLWACATTEGASAEKADDGQALVELSLAPLAVTRALPFPADGKPHFCNDIALVGGTVVVTDSDGGAVWKVAGETLAPLVAAGGLIYPNGVASAPDGRHAYVAHFGGLSRVSPADGKAEPVTAPAGATLVGIDGLVPAPGGGLLAVQNGFAPARLVRLSLSADGASVSKLEVLAAARPEFAVPTTVAVSGDAALLIANSQLDQLDKKPRPELAPTLVLRVKLGR
ncbi:MAG TPA: hypothetical protein VED40_01990 [Azospirillaceae bacterium]|nr:hypothetical protein [Azospirillaceae bacterium]